MAKELYNNDRRFDIKEEPFVSAPDPWAAVEAAANEYKAWADLHGNRWFCPEIMKRCEDDCYCFKAADLVEEKPGEVILVTSPACTKPTMTTLTEGV